MDVPVQLQMVDDGWMFSIKALLDSGCTGLAINKKFVEKHGISTKKVARPIPIYNMDGTRNKAGSIREYVEI
jgi:predicted aspartyl protease